MSRLQALRENLKAHGKSLVQLRDKMNADGYAATAEDEANWAKVNTDYNATLAKIGREEQGNAVEKYLTEADAGKRAGAIADGDGGVRAKGGDGAAAGTEAMRSLALTAWCRSQFDMDLTAEQEAACQATRINPNRKQLTFDLLSTQRHAGLQAAMSRVNPLSSQDAGAKYMAALSNQTPTSGGYLIPPLTLLSQLEINMLAFGGLLAAAETITTTTGERMGWPTVNDTSNRGRRLGANAAAMSSVQPTFGQVYWDAYKYTSDAVLIPFELLEDANADLPGLLGPMLGERLGRIFNEECTTGTGNSMPKGIVTAAGTGVTSLKAAKIGADDLMRLEHSVDPAYRSGAAYMMHDSILLQIRLLKDGDGQYLFKSGAQFGIPDSINGRPIAVNQSMTTSYTVTGDVPILFGQLNKYKVRRVNGLRMYRLEERFRDNDQDGFVCLLRGDGNLLTAGTSPVNKLTIQ